MENCSKSMYIHLCLFVYESGIVSDVLADLLAKYFPKFQFRYGFHIKELGKINKVLLKYQHRRRVMEVLQMFGAIFTERVKEDAKPEDLLSILSVGC